MPYPTRRILRPLLGLVLLTSPFTVAAQTDWFSQAIQLLQSEDPDIRLSAVRELSRLADARAVEPLIRTLNDRDAGVKAATITALGWIKDTRGTDPIITMLNDNDPAIVCLAAQALAMIGDTRAVNPLIFFLQSNNLSVKFAAVEALGKLKDPRAVEPLSVLLRDHDGLQKKAQDALIEMGPTAVEHLCLLLQADDHVLRFYAADLLTKIHDQFLFRCGNEPRPPILDPRRLAAIALGEIGDRRAITALTEALKDDSPSLRADAAKAVTNIEATGVKP